MQSAEFGRPYTPFLKIKLDADLARNTEILRALRQALAPAAGTWSLDANAAWTPALALAHLELLASDEFAGIVYMVEQPFAVRLEGPEAVQAWAEVKAAYGRSGIFIYADERLGRGGGVVGACAFGNFADAPAARQCVHGGRCGQAGARVSRGELQAGEGWRHPRRPARCVI